LKLANKSFISFLSGELARWLVATSLGVLTKLLFFAASRLGSLLKWMGLPWPAILRS